MPFAAAVFFLVLPLSLAFWRDKRLPRFPFERLMGRQDRLRAVPLLAAGALLVPGSLLLMASGVVSGRWVFFVFSTLGVLAGVYTLLGLRFLPLALVPIVVTWMLGGDGGLLAFNVCAILAAIGAGELLASLLRGRELVFAGALAAIDIVVVSLGLPADAVMPAILGPAPALAATPPIYAGVAFDGVFLGGIDIALAWLVGSYLRRCRRRTDLRALAVFFVAQLVMVSAGLLLAIGLPATLPPLAALLTARYLTPRRLRKARWWLNLRAKSEPVLPPSWDSLS